MVKDLSQASAAQVEEELGALQDTDPRQAGELAYALAHLYLDRGDREGAARFGKDSIGLLESGGGIQTAEQAAPRHCVIGGIAMPSSFIHEGVVKDRLGLRGLQL